MIKLRQSKLSENEVADRITIKAFPGYGRLLATGDWKIHISGVAFQVPENFNMRQRMMIRMLGNAMQATHDQLECDVFQRRVAPFLSDAEHKRRVVVSIGDRDFRLRKRTYKNGHFRGTVVVDAGLIAKAKIQHNGSGAKVAYGVRLENERDVFADGTVQLIVPGRVGVISDIDDTIKVSGVGDKKELLTNTFLRDFQGVAGMAELYQRWANLGTTFHYVSSSPWQLFDALQDLHSELRFPAGTMHLRNFRIRDQLFKKFRIRRHGKVSAIQSLMRGLPQQEFVLIGDSGEKDPEIYRKICRRFPGRVRGLFIRDLPHRSMTIERMQKLRRALPDGVCRRFKDASALESASAEIFDR